MPGQKAAEEQRRDEILNAACEVATERGLNGLTIRRVAAAAGLSHGLVHFHFKSKDVLLAALLDHVLASTATLSIEAVVAEIPSPADRLVVLLHQEMARVRSDGGRIRLLFDFWLAGTRNRRLRARMRSEFAHYRASFRLVAEEVVRAEPDRFESVSADALATVAVAFLKGCAVQAVIDPGFDVEDAAGAARALVESRGSRARDGGDRPGSGMVRRRSARTMRGQV